MHLFYLKEIFLSKVEKKNQIYMVYGYKNMERKINQWHIWQERKIKFKQNKF